MGRAWAWFLAGASLLLACDARRAPGPSWAGRTSLVLIHTADLHSHVFPELTQISAGDARRGLGAR
ncbi:MAG TPA: hypothetical protein VGL19_16030, partial [Polyangiaceae bacterium]